MTVLLMWRQWLWRKKARQLLFYYYWMKTFRQTRPRKAVGQWRQTILLLLMRQWYCEWQGIECNNGVTID